MPAGQGLRAFDPPHVLIVEDTDMCSMVLEMLLGDLGCSSDIVEDGQEALDKLRAVDPDLYSLILMDLRMPVMDGFEATEAIKNTLKLTTPVIALTADDTQVHSALCCAPLRTPMQSLRTPTQPLRTPKRTRAAVG